jgi:hypothetical protein
VSKLHIFVLLADKGRFTEWAKEYGEIYSLKMASSTIVVLNTAETVAAILEKQSANTAGRPSMFLYGQMEGGDVKNVVM